MKKYAIILLSILLVSCNGMKQEKPVKPVPTEPELETTLQIAVVKMEDDGKTGEKIGCGDSIIYIEKTAEGTKLEETKKIQLALKELFAIGVTAVDNEYYNGLQHSKNLKVESVNKTNNGDNSIISVILSGELISAGTCDDPRIKEQIYSTVKANSSADEVQVYINDQELEEYFDMSGGAE